MEYCLKPWKRKPSSLVVTNKENAKQVRGKGAVNTEFWAESHLEETEGWKILTRIKAYFLF